jgi:hypothetical protein
VLSGYVVTDPFVGFFDRLKDAFACECPICVRHGEVHEQVPTVIFGSTVQVDRELAPLLEGLRARGVVTVASCVDLGGAVARLVPERLSELVAGRDAPGLHSGRVVADRLMYVRTTSGAAANEYLEEAEQHGALVTRAKPLAQVAFPRELLPVMTALAKP